MSQFLFPITKTGGVVKIDLGRPEEGNSLTRDMMRSLSDLIRTHGADPSVNVIILEARGSYFCKGRDGRGENSAGMKPYEIRDQLMGAVLGVYEAISASSIPVIACVQGPAIGFGAALAGACDITLVAEAASFAFTEIKHGIPPTMAITAVSRNVPSKALAYLIYSAKTISAQEAVVFGLASQVVETSKLHLEVDKLASEIASKPRLVLETIKKFMANSHGLSASMSAEYAGVLLALVRS